MPGAGGAYIAPIDGIRAISVMVVVFSHYGFGFVPGLFGVTIFFFVSGYLITGQLLTHEIRLRQFYVRRMLRLYPVLLVVVALGAVLFPLLGGHMTAGDVTAALAYAANYWEIAGGFDPGDPNRWHPYGVLWSLAVEEHYYLAFPLLALWLASRHLAFATVLGVLIAAVGAWRIVLQERCAGACDPFRIINGTDTRIDSILFGALLTVLLAGPLRTALLHLLRNRLLVAAGAASLLLSLALRGEWFRQTLRFDLQGAGLFLCVGALLYDARWAVAARLLSWRPLLLGGRLSYSIYLWHWLILSVVGQVAPEAWLAPLRGSGTPPGWWVATVLPALLGATLTCSLLSYYGIERPMMALRRRFGSATVADSAV